MTNSLRRYSKPPSPFGIKNSTEKLFARGRDLKPNKYSSNICTTYHLQTQQEVDVPSDLKEESHLPGYFHQSYSLESQLLVRGPSDVNPRLAGMKQDINCQAPQIGCLLRKKF